MPPRYRRSFFLRKRANAHRLLNRWAFVRFMAFYTMYFIFLVRGFMVWSKFYFSYRFYMYHIVYHVFREKSTFHRQIHKFLRFLQ